MSKTPNSPVCVKYKAASKDTLNTHQKKKKPGDGGAFDPNSWEAKAGRSSVSMRPTEQIPGKPGLYTEKPCLNKQKSRSQPHYY